MDIRPDVAVVKRNGKLETVKPETVKIGEEIVVKPGEKIPLDGTIIDGSSMLDTSALTGESVPRSAKIGEKVLSGCINQSGVLTIKVEKEFGESTVSKILDLVENASNKKSKSENFITKFAKIYTPTVVGIAVLLAIIPPFLLNWGSFSEWLERALTFLVVSCPCALVISIPLGFFGGIGGASRKGVLIKGSNYLELLSKTDIFVFDKTGTLTEGVFEVQKINPVDISEEELLKIAVYAESYSNHPISASIKKAYQKEINQEIIGKTEEISGKGIISQIENKTVVIGNNKIMQEKGIEYTELPFTATQLAELIKLIDKGTISSKIAKEVFEVMFEEDVDPEKYVEEKGLKTVNDEGALRKTIEEIIAANPQSVEDYHNGKDRAIGFLVGQTMKAMKGKADPAMVNQILKELL